MNPSKAVVGYGLFYIPSDQNEENFMLLCVCDNDETVDKILEDNYNYWKNIFHIRDNYIKIELNLRQMDKLKFIADLILQTDEYTDEDDQLEHTMVIDYLIENYLKREHPEYLKL